MHGLLQEQKGGEQGMQERLQKFVEELKTMPVAIQTQAANEQHYEVCCSAGKPVGDPAGILADVLASECVGSHRQLSTLQKQQVLLQPKNMLHHTVTGAISSAVSHCNCLEIPWSSAGLATQHALLLHSLTPMPGGKGCTPHCCKAWQAQHCPQRLPAPAQLGTCGQVSTSAAFALWPLHSEASLSDLTTLQSCGMLHCPLQVPTDYFLLVLGKHKKYSSCLWPDSSLTLDEAEAAMLGKQCCISVFEVKPAQASLNSSLMLDKPGAATLG